MPYRAMFSTIVTACLALLGLGMWLWCVAPLVAATAAIEATSAPGHPVPVESQAHLLKSLVQGVMLLSFLLICLLLIVGFAATFREWARYGTRRSARRMGSKTAYVDAWKIAGERLKVDDAEEP